MIFGLVLHQRKNVSATQQLGVCEVWQMLLALISLSRQRGDFAPTISHLSGVHTCALASLSVRPVPPPCASSYFVARSSKSPAPFLLPSLFFGSTSKHSNHYRHRISVMASNSTKTVLVAGGAGCELLPSRDSTRSVLFFASSGFSYRLWQYICRFCRNIMSP